MKTFNFLNMLMAGLLTLTSLTLGNPIPDTTDMTPNNTNAAEDALFDNYYIWCGTVALTLDCSSPPNNYECQTNGAPYGDRTVANCLHNCRCLPECSYMAALNTINCLSKKLSKRDWIQSLQGSVAQGTSELLDNTISNTTTAPEDTTDMAPNPNPIPNTTTPDTTDMAPNPIPNTAVPDTTPNNTTENALFNKYYIWCESVYLTGQCTAAPGNWVCTPNGIPTADRSVGSCRNNCRCLPECSYMQAMFAVVCAVGGG